MAAKKKKTEERKQIKNATDRARYKKFKNDPAKALEMKAKNREKYLKRKEKGQIKMASEMSEREKRSKRKLWRSSKREYREKKRKTQETEESHENHPAEVPEVTDRTTDQEEVDNPRAEVCVPYQVLSGRKRAKSSLKKRKREQERLMAQLANKDHQIAQLKRRIARTYFRLRNLYFEGNIFYIKYVQLLLGFECSVFHWNFSCTIEIYVP